MGESAEALTATVGPRVGRLSARLATVFEGLSVEIPAGALAEDTDISTTRTGDTGELPPAALRCRPEFKIEPAGLALEKAAVVTSLYNEELIT